MTTKSTLLIMESPSTSTEKQRKRERERERGTRLRSRTFSFAFPPAAAFYPLRSLLSFHGQPRFHPPKTASHSLPTPLAPLSLYPAGRRVAEIETSREKKYSGALPSQPAHCLSFSIAMQPASHPASQAGVVPAFRIKNPPWSFTLLPLVLSSSPSKRGISTFTRYPAIPPCEPSAYLVRLSP